MLQEYVPRFATSDDCRTGRIDDVVKDGPNIDELTASSCRRFSVECAGREYRENLPGPG